MLRELLCPQTEEKLWQRHTSVSQTEEISDRHTSVSTDRR